MIHAIVQNIGLFFIKGVLKIFVPIKVYGADAYRDIPRPSIIVVNHSSLFDIFVLLYTFPFWARFFPFRVTMWHKLYHKFFVKIFFSFLWGLSVTKIKGLPLEDSLRDPFMYLKKKRGTICVFPQGKRQLMRGRPRLARRGVAWLALKTNTPILPVYISGLRGGMSPRKFFLRRMKITVYVGTHFTETGDAARKADLDRTRISISKRIEELGKHSTSHDT